MSSKFNELLSLNINDKTEKKKSGYQTLTYLSWSFAWSEFVKVYPEATYEIVKNENGLPYFIDDAGAMCYTKVTAGNITHEMWLPVMDGANKPMRKETYKYTTKNGEKTCLALNMFDVNKTVMRCLVKNLAMFGLGLYIYAGEDLPEEPKMTPEEIDKKNEEAKKALERKESIKEYKVQIGSLQNQLLAEKVTGIEISRSVKKHLGVEKTAMCDDLERLQSFYLHLENKLKDAKQKSAIETQKSMMPNEN